MATVLIHLKDGTTDEFNGVEGRSAAAVELAVGQNDCGRLRLLGRWYDREDIASVRVVGHDG